MKLIRVLLIAAVIYFLGLGAFLLTQPDDKIIINIPTGTSAAGIADILKTNGIISSSRLFLIISHITGSSDRLQSGIYRFSKRMTIPSALYLIKKGECYKLKITIPEGYTTEQIAELLEINKIADKKQFVNYVAKNKLSGYLFPETYFFIPGTNMETVIKTLAGQFIKKINKNVISILPGLGLNEIKKIRVTKKMNLNDIIILASIVEKDAKTDSERKLIAAVFLNRLNKGWYLESCATVRYALKKYKGPLTYKDLKIYSPYNTYKARGLPPEPICNPGLKSIQSVINPDSSDAMFFFVINADSGTHKFSRYYKDHLGGQKSARTK